MQSPSPVVLIGVPSDENSSYLRGCAAAPDSIRAALTAESANTWTETGIDISAPGVLDDAGDLDLGLEGSDFEAIEPGVRQHLDLGRRVLRCRLSSVDQWRPWRNARHRERPSVR